MKHHVPQNPADSAERRRTDIDRQRGSEDSWQHPLLVDELDALCLPSEEWMATGREE